MWPAGWPDQIAIDDHVYSYNGEKYDLLRALGMAPHASDTPGWLSVVAYPMTKKSQEQIAKDIIDRDHPLTCLGLMVLAEKLAQKALGMELFSAGRLAALAVKGWVPFTGWAATRGLRLDGMPIHELLATVYGWQAKCCQEQKDLDRLHISIFGSRNPFGR